MGDHCLRRRELIQAAAAMASSSAMLSAGERAHLWLPRDAAASDRPPRQLAGMSLPALHADYADRLFRQFLPFWDRGGDDKQLGGFLCELNDDGTVADDEKYLWYQGRAVWVYAFLFNEFGSDGRWREVARRTRDFMVRHLYAGEGRWYEKVNRDGTLLEGVSKTVYGWLFAAMGLGEYYLATGREEDLRLAKESVLAAVAAYDDPLYADTHTTRYTAVKLPSAGIRSQGHSMVLLGTLSRLVQRIDDPVLRRLRDEHVDRLMNAFWNPEYGIVNEYLDHHYQRIPGADDHMFAGHAMESLWMVMHDALLRKDRGLFDEAKARARRLLEMCWDYAYEGWGDGEYHVFETPQRGAGPDFNVKTMWAHCEALVACMTALEYTGEFWACEWYERIRAFVHRTMFGPAPGTWRQAVNRFGKDIQRVGVSTKRKDNFHPPRYLMLNLLSVGRMLKNQNRILPFPGGS